MIGMDFVSFLVLLVISVVVAGILHYGLKYYVTPGTASFCGKVVVGYIGAWIGTPVLGSWWPGVLYGPIYIVPAILGSLAFIVLCVDIGQMCAKKSA